MLDAGCKEWGVGNTVFIKNLLSRPRLVLRRFSNTYLPRPTSYILFLYKPGGHTGPPLQRTTYYELRTDVRRKTTKPTPYLLHLSVSSGE